MRIGRVIGRVTLSQAAPALEGARWLIVNPYSREQFSRADAADPGLSPEPSPVIYDKLGGGIGNTIGYVEGAEAAQPFDRPTPIDAISAALIDEIFYQPQNP